MLSQNDSLAVSRYKDFRFYIGMRFFFEFASQVQIVVIGWRNMLVAVTGFGLSIVCLALSHNFYQSLLFLFLQGAFDSVSVLVRGSIMQLSTPDRMRGRVSAINPCSLVHQVRSGILDQVR